MKRSLSNEVKRTRFDMIRQMETPEELGHFLCDLIEDCETCPVKRKCGAAAYQGNGFINYLKEGVREWRP